MDLTGALWRTSSRSGNGDPTGAVLVFAPATWRAFVAVARRPTA